jgi:hypothetical protein
MPVICREIDDLELWQCPRKGLEVALSEQQGKYTVLIAFLNQGVVQFTLDPHGFNGLWSKENHEPVTACERFANLIVPLLSAADVMGAEPDF